MIIGRPGFVAPSPMPRDVKTFLMSRTCRDAIRALDDPATVDWLDKVIKTNTFAFGDVVDEGADFEEPSLIKIGQLRELKIGRSTAILRVVNQASYPTKLNDLPVDVVAEIPPVCTYTLVPTVARIPLDLPVANVAYNPRPSLAGTCPARVESEDQSAARLIEEKRQQDSEGPAPRSRQKKANVSGHSKKKRARKNGHDKVNGNTGTGTDHKQKKKSAKKKKKKKKQLSRSRRYDSSSSSSSSESSSDSVPRSSSEDSPSSPDDQDNGLLFLVHFILNCYFWFIIIINCDVLMSRCIHCLLFACRRSGIIWFCGRRCGSKGVSMRRKAGQKSRRTTSGRQDRSPRLVRR
jgi:hypothetical protein